MIVISPSKPLLRRAKAAASPPLPPPTITTFLGVTNRPPQTHAEPWVAQRIPAALGAGCNDAGDGMTQGAFDEVSLVELRRRRSQKWRRFPDDILPAFVAEMA